MRANAVRSLITFILIAMIASLAMAEDAHQRRLAVAPVADPALDALAKALADPDPLVARTAARVLPSKGTEAMMALGKALRHDDVLVRRTAAMGLGALGADALELIKRAVRDDAALVRQGAVLALADIPDAPEARKLLERASDDESQLVKSAALLVSRASFATVDSIRLPKDGWKFSLDPDGVGRDNEWFAPDFDDSDWDEIEIEQAWQEAAYDYIGVTWYRRTIELPDREPPAKAMLDFQGVDESAWVWVNGEYAGEHDVGPSGWNKPFRIGVTDMLRWGGENQITVRAMNTAHAGGIWRPVSIVLLEPKK